MPSLDVYFFDRKVGELTEKNSRLSFKYNDSADTPISVSLPIRPEPFADKESRGFFENLLPEGNIRKEIARNRGISENNPFTMLREIGGECAGAVSLYQPGEVPDESDTLKRINDRDLLDILERQNVEPLLIGERVRLSLAGAQHKIALVRKGTHWYLPKGKNVSTCIIKPGNNRFNKIVCNEDFCMKTADKLGLGAAKCNNLSLLDNEALMVKRYDRKVLKDGRIQRIHQEDFCQSLSLAGKKYQNEGGPSIKQCFNLIGQVSASPLADKFRFWLIIIYNFLIGNSDAHGKNFSFLYDENGIRLSPFYDLVSTQIYPGLDYNLAMSINGEYNPDKIRIKDFIEQGKSLGFKQSFVVDTIKSMIKNIGELQPEVFALICEIKEVTALDNIIEDIIALTKRRSKQLEV